MASRILRVLLRGRAMYSHEVADSLGDCDGHLIHKYCRDLERRGYIVRTRYSTARRVQWAATDLLRTTGVVGALRPRLERSVLAAVEDGCRTVREIMERVGSKRATIVSALHRLRRKGALQMQTIDGRVVVTLTAEAEASPRAAVMPTFPDDDEHWTPRTYVNPIRARALGLPSSLNSRAA